MNARRDRGQLPGLVAVTVLLAGLLGTLLWVYLLVGPYRLGSGLAQSAVHLRKAEDRLSTGKFKAVRFQTLLATALAERARTGLDEGRALLDVLRSLPSVGDAVGEVDHLVAAAEHSAEAAEGAFRAAAGALDGPGRVLIQDPADENASIIRYDRLEAVTATLVRVRAAIEQTKAELEAVRTSRLPAGVASRVADGIETAETAQQRLTDTIAGFEVLPGILGADGPRAYLIGMQNPAEQRGTGGAILQYQLLKFDDGRISLGSKKETGSVYRLDRNRRQLEVPLPRDAWLVRAIDDAQRFGNSNWSPDWPSSAQLMVDYAAASDARLRRLQIPPLDGVIAVDPFVLEELMPGIGPFRIEFGNRITSGNVVRLLLYRLYGSYPQPHQRRPALRQVVDGFFERVTSPTHPSELVAGASDALARKHILVWMKDPKEQAFIERMGWDGAIERKSDPDYLYVVQQNVGGNKLDYFAQSGIDTSIELDGSDAVVSTTIEAHNGVFMPQPRWILGDRPDMAKGVHYPMLNLYVQRRARLVDATFEGKLSNHPAIGAWTGGLPPEHFEKGKRVWSATLSVPPGEDRSVRFDYRVPGVVTTTGNRHVYRLLVQHQPKVNPETLAIELRLPAGAEEVHSPGWEREGRTLRWEDKLDADVVMEVSWTE
jgi:hypothetical protein